MGSDSVFSKFPVINVNSDITLRCFQESDAEDYFNYISHPKISCYIPDECLPASLEATHNEIKYNIDLFRYGRSIYWAIENQANGKLIGSCGFNYWNRDHRRAEISYDIAYEYWGRGIATNVARAVLSFGFINMEINRIEATVTPGNQASFKVLSKLGFKKEGILREQKLLRGKFYDATMLSLLSKEYLKF